MIRKNVTKPSSGHSEISRNSSVDSDIENIFTPEIATELSIHEASVTESNNISENTNAEDETNNHSANEDNSSVAVMDNNDLLGNLFQDSEITRKETDHIIDSHISWKQNQYEERLRGEQTIKDLLEEYDKPKPVLVTDFNDPENKNFNEIQKSNNDQLDESLIFINENRRFLTPDSLNLASENSQESPANGPSRPMFLVAVRPLPHPDGHLRPIPVSEGNPIISFSNGNYPSATFLQESRTGKFMPQGRSAGSVRGAVQFSSPSFSVSHPQTINLRHFAPQTRLSRRIGHASSVPFSQSYSEEDKVIPVGDSMTSASESQNVHFYEEHSAGSVHIGVDRHTPTDEIRSAFIEIKKSRT